MAQLTRPIRSILGGLQVGAALALLLLIAALLLGTVPSLAGYESFVVLSGSMEPAIHTGDLAVVAPTTPDKLMVGDVITYRTAQRPDVVVTHRLVGIGLDAQGRLQFETKGDANNAVDQVTVDQRAVLGRVAYAIPKVGYLINFARRPEDLITLIAIPGLLLALDYLLGFRKRRKIETPPDEVGDARVRRRTAVSDLLARAHEALGNRQSAVAIALADQAIATDPHSEEAWLFKARCLDDRQERVACLRAGLTVNPQSSRLRATLEGTNPMSAAAG